MAKQIVWKDLTPSESRTLEQLKRAGKEIFEAPIEIESADQLHAMGLTWDQCRTWYFGTKRVTVHLTPSDEQTYRFLRDELRAKHRSEYRERRCMIPGKLKPLIPCPEKNSCKNCPYPQCRDSQLPDLSWDEYVDVMSGVAQWTLGLRSSKGGWPSPMRSSSSLTRTPSSPRPSSSRSITA